MVDTWHHINGWGSAHRLRHVPGRAPRWTYCGRDIGRRAVSDAVPSQYRCGHCTRRAVARSAEAVTADGR